MPSKAPPQTDESQIKDQTDQVKVIITPPADATSEAPSLSTARLVAKFSTLYSKQPFKSNYLTVPTESYGSRYK